MRIWKAIWAVVSLAIAAALFTVLVLPFMGDLVESVDPNGDEIEVEASPTPSPLSAETDSTEGRGRFPDYCPPQRGVNGAREYKQRPDQTFSQQFLDSFVRLERLDGTVVWIIDTRGFCIFQINDLVFVVYHDYEDSVGRQVFGVQELRTWAQENGVEADICQIIWSRCSQEFQEVPQRPEEPREPEPPSLLEGGLVLASSDFSSLLLSGSTDTWEKEKREK